MTLRLSPASTGKTDPQDRDGCRVPGSRAELARLRTYVSGRGRLCIWSADALLAWLASASQATSQAFVVDASAYPTGLGIDSSTMAVALGDVDLDGDWDAVLADGGGTVGVDQSRLWINLGGLQAGEPGKFADETAIRLPSMPAVSFDVDLADIDGDGDPDIHLTNSAEFISQGSYWWVNLGAAQGGSFGYYANETAQRWIGLGQPGSSIAPSIVAPGGSSFMDFSEESAFADLDNDGDLDLVHTSRGYWTVGGDMPMRVFLNDGQGHFQEFNPGGFMPLNGKLKPGDPGLWCEGSYEPGTTDITGTHCDVAGRTFDVEIGDIDGDFDADIALSDVTDGARMFANRLDASALAPQLSGQLGFRDVTNAAMPTSLLEKTLSQLLDNFDGGDDVELVSVVGQPEPPGSFPVHVLHNDGGSFGAPSYFPWPIAGQASPWEVNALDYDGDGDLDLFVSDYGWSASYPERLYRNDGGSVFTEVPMPSWFVSPSEDAATADLDGDGDYDIHVATFNPNPEILLENITNVPDQHGPQLPKLEQLPDGAAQPDGVAVRTYVYDNAPAHVTAKNSTHLEVAVDGVSLPPAACTHSFAQVFRGELPGNLVGTVSYRFVSEDAYGNTGASATKTYASTAVAAYASAYGAGTAGVVSGSQPTLGALSIPFGGSTLFLAGHADGPPGSLGILVLAAGKQVPPLPIPGLVVANIATPLVLMKVVSTDAHGDAVVPLAVPAGAVGIEAYAQFCVLDPTPAGDLLSTSMGLAFMVQ